MIDLNAIKKSTYVDNLQVIYSGSVHTKKNSIKIIIENLIFIFEFKEDEEQSRYVGEIKEDILYIYIYNHNNILGEGVLDPVEIGFLSDQKLYFTYIINTFSDGSKRFEYVFYVS